MCNIASFLSKTDNANLMQTSREVYFIINGYIYNKFTFTITKNKRYSADFLSKVERMYNVY